MRSHAHPRAVHPLILAVAAFAAAVTGFADVLASTTSAVAPRFASVNTNTAKQIYQVAKMIDARRAMLR